MLDPGWFLAMRADGFVFERVRPAAGIEGFEAREQGRGRDDTDEFLTLVAQANTTRARRELEPA